MLYGCSVCNKCPKHICSIIKQPCSIYIAFWLRFTCPNPLSLYLSTECGCVLHACPSVFNSPCKLPPNTPMSCRIVCHSTLWQSGLLLSSATSDTYIQIYYDEIPRDPCLVSRKACTAHSCRQTMHCSLSSGTLPPFRARRDTHTPTNTHKHTHTHTYTHRELESHGMWFFLSAGNWCALLQHCLPF
jgi:hypothetical protein